MDSLSRDFAPKCLKLKGLSSLKINADKVRHFYSRWVKLVLQGVPSGAGCVPCAVCSPKSLLHNFRDMFPGNMRNFCSTAFLLNVFIL